MTWTQVWTNVTNLFQLTQPSAILLLLVRRSHQAVFVCFGAFYTNRDTYIPEMPEICVFSNRFSMLFCRPPSLPTLYFWHRNATEPNPHPEAKSFVTLYLLIYKLFRFLCPHSSATFGKNSGWLPVMVLASLKPFKCLNVCIYRRWLLIKQLETGNVVLSWSSSGQTLTVPSKYWITPD